MSKKKGEAEFDSFEEGLSQLEATVKKLESGELSLEDALDAFERGIALVRALSQKLTEVEKRVEILVKEAGGEMRLRDWEEEET